jgi:hypothetical protein
MKKRFTEEQIIGILKEAEAGMKVGALQEARDLGCDILQLEVQVWRYVGV